MFLIVDISVDREAGHEYGRTVGLDVVEGRRGKIEVRATLDCDVAPWMQNVSRNGVNLASVRDDLFRLAPAIIGTLPNNNRVRWCEAQSGSGTVILDPHCEEDWLSRSDATGANRLDRHIGAKLAFGGIPGNSHGGFSRVGGLDGSGCRTPGDSRGIGGGPSSPGSGEERKNKECSPYDGSACLKEREPCGILCSVGGAYGLLKISIALTLIYCILLAIVCLIRGDTR